MITVAWAMPFAAGKSLNAGAYCGKAKSFCEFAQIDYHRPFSAAYIQRVKRCMT